MDYTIFSIPLHSPWILPFHIQMGYQNYFYILHLCVNSYAHPQCPTVATATATVTIRPHKKAIHTNWPVRKLERWKICKKCVFPKSREYIAIAIPFQATSGRIGVFRKHTNYPQSSLCCSRRLPLPLHRRALHIVNESLNTNHFSSSFHFVGGGGFSSYSALTALMAWPGLALT